MNKKVAISFFVVVLLGITVYFLLSKKSTPIVTEQPISQNLPNTKQTQTPPQATTDNISPQTLPPSTTVSTTDWKTYSFLNDKFGFKFNYPSYFTITSDSGYSDGLGNLLTVQFAGQGQYFSLEITGNSAENDSSIIYDSNKKICLARYGNEEGGRFIYSEKKINSSYPVCFYDSADMGGVWNQILYFIIHPTQDILFTFNYFTSDDSKAFTPIEEILSTFKFTK